MTQVNLSEVETKRCIWNENVIVISCLAPLLSLTDSFLLLAVQAGHHPAANTLKTSRVRFNPWRASLPLCSDAGGRRGMHFESEIGLFISAD